MCKTCISHYFPMFQKITMKNKVLDLEDRGGISLQRKMELIVCSSTTNPSSTTSHPILVIKTN